MELFFSETSQDVRHFSAQVVFLIPVHFLWPFALSIPGAAALGSAGCRCVTDPERQTYGMPGSRSRTAVCFLVLSQPAQPALLLLTKRELELVAQPASCSPEQELSFPGSPSHLQSKAQGWSSPVTWASSCSFGCKSRSKCWSWWDSVLLSTVKIRFYCL